MTRPDVRADSAAGVTNELAPGADYAAPDSGFDSVISTRILELIQERDLRAGDKLPTEAKIASEFSISRQKAREGLLHLESLGIVRSRQGSGRVLLDRSFHTIPALLGSGIDHSPSEILDMLAIRQVLEVGFLPAVVMTIDKASLGRIWVAADGMRARARAGESFAKEDQAFHDALFSCLDNQLLISLLQKFWNLFEDIDEDVLRHKENTDETIRHHQNVLLAVERGDAALAQFHMNVHFYEIREILVDFAYR